MVEKGDELLDEDFEVISLRYPQAKVAEDSFNGVMIKENTMIKLFVYKVQPLSFCEGWQSTDVLVDNIMQGYPSDLKRRGKVHHEWLTEILNITENAEQAIKESKFDDVGATNYPLLAPLFPRGGRGYSDFMVAIRQGSDCPTFIVSVVELPYLLDKGEGDVVTLSSGDVT